MKLDRLKENVGALWGNLSEGIRHLWRSASGALTRFRPGDKTDLPTADTVGDAAWLPSHGWSLLGGDVFEDDDRVVVRLEVPGLEKDDLDIEIRDDALIVSGEKRFERQSSEGRWRVLQCAYGQFRRVVPLPAAVKAEAASARYKNGVLRVELPKAVPGKQKTVPITAE